MLGTMVRRIVGGFNPGIDPENPSCPLCGSMSVIIRGFEGINQRCECYECGCSVRVQ
jgi:hypothetical protein